MTGLQCQVCAVPETSVHLSGIKRSPCSALVGGEVHVGLATSSLPQEVLSKLDNEEDLRAVIMDQPSTSTNISSNVLRVQCSGAIGFQFTSHPPCPVFRCHRFPVYQPSSVSSVPVPSVSSLPATLRVQCSGAIGFQFTSHPPCPVFRRHRFPWMPIL